MHFYVVIFTADLFGLKCFYTAYKMFSEEQPQPACEHSGRYCLMNT